MKVEVQTLEMLACDSLLAGFPGSVAVLELNNSCGHESHQSVMNECQ